MVEITTAAVNALDRIVEAGIVGLKKLDGGPIEVVTDRAKLYRTVINVLVEQATNENLVVIGDDVHVLGEVDVTPAELDDENLDNPNTNEAIIV